MHIFCICIDTFLYHTSAFSSIEQVPLTGSCSEGERDAGVIIVDDDDLDPIEAVDVEEGGLLHQGEEYFGVDVPVEGEDYYQMYVPE